MLSSVLLRPEYYRHSGSVWGLTSYTVSNSEYARRHGNQAAVEAYSRHWDLMEGACSQVDARREALG